LKFKTKLVEKYLALMIQVKIASRMKFAS